MGTAVASIAAGATAGGAIMTMGVLVLRVLQTGITNPVTLDVGFAVLTAAVAGGIITAVVSGWSLARAIHDPWRRGVIAALAGFGGSVLAVLATPADVAGGRVGLTIYLLLLLALAFVAFRAAKRAGARE